MKKCIFIIGLTTFLVSCNSSHIEELENQVSQQQNVIEAQKRRISELESQLSEYVNYYNQQVAAAQQAEWNRRNAAAQQADWHKRNAEDHMRSAEFWRQSGNDFLYESEIRNVQSELDMIR